MSPKTLERVSFSKSKIGSLQLPLGSLKLGNNRVSRCWKLGSRRDWAV